MYFNNNNNNNTHISIPSIRS